MYLKGTGCEGMNWIELAQDRLQCCILVFLVIKLRFCNVRDFFIIDITASLRAFTIE